MTLRVQFLRPFRFTNGVECAVIGPYVFRAVTNRVRTGQIDTSRSHYTVNGRRVRGTRYRQMRRRAWRG